MTVKMGAAPVEIEGFSNASAVLKGGVYVLVHKGEVVYVGKSKRLLNRLAAHMSAWAAKRKEKMPWTIAKLGIYYDEVHIRPEHPDRIDALEQAMIELYKPRHNIQHKAPGPTRAAFSLNINGVALGFNQPKPVEIVRRI